MAEIIAIPERSLAYAPLLLAVKEGLYTTPPTRVALMQFASVAGVVAAVAEGRVLAGALPLPALVNAASDAPLAAAGALTRRCGAYVAVAPDVALAGRAADGLFGQRWGGLRTGLVGGEGGTETLLRYLSLGLGLPVPHAVPETQSGPVGPPPAVAMDGAPRWIRYPTETAMVAALVDSRVSALAGGPLAAAHVAMLRAGRVEPVDGAFDGAADVTSLLATVLAVRQPAGAAPTTAPRALLRTTLAACARAARELSGPDGAAAIRRALPEIDALTLVLAHRFAAPDPDRTIYATGPAPARAVFERLIDLERAAGNLSAGSLDPRSLIADASV